MRNVEWLGEVQTAIENMWTKLRKYYDKSAKPVSKIGFSRLQITAPISLTNIRQSHYRASKNNMIHQNWFVVSLWDAVNDDAPLIQISIHQKEKITTSSRITLIKNGTSRPQIHSAGGKALKQRTRNCRKWLAMSLLFLQQTQELRENLAYWEGS